MLLVSQHIVSLLVFLYELGSYMITIFLQLALSLFSYLYSLLQGFNLLLFVVQVISKTADILI